MGRYDKIKVYSGGAWKSPKQIKVYTGTKWEDLGTYDSANTKTLKVCKNNSFVRATLNKKVTTEVTDRYATGSFSLKPASGFCRCPDSSYNDEHNWYFKVGSIKKTASGDKRIFYCGVSDNYVSIYWLSNGKIRVRTCWDGSYTDLTSSNAVGLNTAVNLQVYSNKGSYKTYIKFNGTTTSKNQYETFMFNNATNTVGDSGIEFRGTLSAAGCSYSKDYSVSFTVSTASAADGAHTKITHKETTRQVVSWV